VLSIEDRAVERFVELELKPRPVKPFNQDIAHCGSVRATDDSNRSVRKRNSDYW
jgi:hypothetical protein